MARASATSRICIHAVSPAGRIQPASRSRLECYISSERERLPLHITVYRRQGGNKMPSCLARLLEGGQLSRLVADLPSLVCECARRGRSLLAPDLLPVLSVAARGPHSSSKRLISDISLGCLQLCPRDCSDEPQMQFHCMQR